MEASFFVASSFAEGSFMLDIVPCLRLVRISLQVTRKVELNLVRGTDADASAGVGALMVESMDGLKRLRR